MNETVDLATASHLSVLLGAGASAGAGLPDWNELAVRLLQGAGAIRDLATATAYLNRTDPTLAAEAARRMSRDWPELIRTALYGSDGAFGAPTVLHLATAALAAQRPANETSLFTLNFDELLETALRDVLDDLHEQRRIFSRAAHQSRGEPGSHEVNHLHGIVSAQMEKYVEGVVLTLSDFNQLGADPRPWQVAALQEAISKGPMVLAGTSYRDGDIRQWLHDMRPAAGSQHAVVALLARQGLGLSVDQFEAVRDAVREQWSGLGIRPLLLHDHSDAAQILWELPHLNRPGYRAPRKRAASVWARQIENFGVNQQQHSEWLDEDRSSLPCNLDEDCDLTLWLSDGSPELVRWSSHDREYRSLDKLRRVPLGHDSPWLAGKVMAASEVLVESSDDSSSGRRWRTIVAGPVTVEAKGGPPLVVGAVTAATNASLGRGLQEEDWRTAVADLVEIWGERLVDPDSR